METFVILGGVVEWLTTHLAETIENSIGKKVKPLKPVLALILSLVIVWQIKTPIVFTGTELTDKIITALVVSFGSRAVHEFYKVFKPIK